MCGESFLASLSVKPLERLTGPRDRAQYLVGVADALSHALSPGAFCRTNTREITLADRPRQSKRDVVHSMIGTSIDQISNFVYAEKTNAGAR